MSLPNSMLSLILIVIKNECKKGYFQSLRTNAKFQHEEFAIREDL